MTTEQKGEEKNLEKLNANLVKIEELSGRLVSALSRKKPISPSLQGPSGELFMKAAAAYMSEMVANPAKIFEHQIGYWGKALKHYVEANQTLAQGKLEAPADPSPKDRRFANPLWDTHPYFNFIKQQYLFSSEAIAKAVQDLDGLEERDKRRIEYFSRQIVDMFSPTNFLATNPDALARAVETDGQSLVDGLENLVRDMERNEGELIVSLANREAFSVGTNLAQTEGAVVYRNRLFELIQYAPRTETVKAVPIVIFPPWINKFYILDLKPENSLIRWVVDQGYTLFVVSWKNPDASYAETGLGDYVEEGYLTALDIVRRITAQPEVNAVGYCIAGTTLALTLALLEKRGIGGVRSATFFTTLTDFSDPGDVGVYLDNDFVDGIEEEARQRGLLHSFFMSRTFSYLRANDLIYSPAIRSYMMGETPPAFDLLYWNGDGTNLPAKMAIEYLRGLCQEDRFAKEGFELLGERLRLGDIRHPLCAIACEADHIAPWASSYAGIQKMASESKTFILSQSGHIAGVVNPPAKKKYGHYLNDDLSLAPEEWKAAASFNEGSWWPRWGAWLSERSGEDVPARVAGSEEFPVLAPAPGTFVSEVVAE